MEIPQRTISDTQYEKLTEPLSVHFLRRGKKILRYEFTESERETFRLLDNFGAIGDQLFKNFFSTFSIQDLNKKDNPSFALLDELEINLDALPIQQRQRKILKKTIDRLREQNAAFMKFINESPIMVWEN